MTEHGRRVIFGVTIGTSADKLLRGQLGWLRAQGWDVSLVVNDDPRGRAAAEREGVSFLPIPMARNIDPIRDLMSLVRWVRLLKRERPDVVNVSTPKAALVGTLAARIVSVPRRVYVMRGLRLEGATGFLRAILWATERLTVLGATDVIVVSPSLGEAAREAGVLRGRPTWIVGEGSSNGVPAAAVAQQVDSGHAEGLRASLGFAPEDVVVGYVGRLAPDKGVDTLLAALERIQDARVRALLIGSAEGLDPGEWGDRVTHVEWTDDVWRHYSAMDVLCLPTRREGFPNVVLEAAAAGVPAVTTRATGAVDSVVDGETGMLVDIDDVRGLAEALQRLASNPNERRRMGAAAAQRVRTHFRPSQVWSGVQDIMQGVVGQTTRRI